MRGRQLRPLMQGAGAARVDRGNAGPGAPVVVQAYVGGYNPAVFGMRNQGAGSDQTGHGDGAGAGLDETRIYHCPSKKN